MVLYQHLVGARKGEDGMTTRQLSVVEVCTFSAEGNSCMSRPISVAVLDSSPYNGTDTHHYSATDHILFHPLSPHHAQVSLAMVSG